MKRNSNSLMLAVLLMALPAIASAADGSRLFKGRFAENWTTYSEGWNSGYDGMGAGLLSAGRGTQDWYYLPDCKTHRAGVPAAYAPFAGLVDIDIKTICNRVLTGQGTDNRFLFDLRLAAPGKYVRTYAGKAIPGKITIQVPIDSPKKSWKEAEAEALRLFQTAQWDQGYLGRVIFFIRHVTQDQSARSEIVRAYRNSRKETWGASVADVAVKSIVLKSYNLEPKPYNYDTAIESYEFEFMPESFTVEID
jgi:hypothetical protein